MGAQKTLSICGVALVVFGLLNFIAGILYWDWWPRLWWPLAGLGFLLACMVTAIILRQQKLEARLAELEKRR